MNVSVTGQFDVRLAEAIDLGGETQPVKLDQLEFRTEGGEAVAVRPGEVESTDDGPVLTSLWVWASRRVELPVGADGALQLSREVEAEFENIMLESVRRVITAIRRKTGQWWMDPARSVRSFSPKYTWRDDTVGSDWELPPGTRKLPAYAKSLIRFRNLPESLLPDTWTEVSADLRQWKEPPLYEDLVYAAKAYREQFRFDAAVLYAAIATDLLIRDLCMRLLVMKQLSDDQCDAILKDRRVPSLIALAKAMHHTSGVDWNKTESLFSRRNKLAHGRRIGTSWQHAAEAIGVAEALKRELASLPRGA